MNLEQINEIEQATKTSRDDVLRLGVALLFIVGVMLYTASIGEPGGIMLIAAAVIGAYMAMNIGANDVANNVGPAVGAQAMSMTAALAVAAIFEAAGALIAGGEVVSTIRSGIIDPALVPDSNTFVWLMMAALLAGAIWLNVATAAGAPVSTTHSIVGAVLGAGVAASGFGVANWSKMGAIVVSWLVSPLAGAVVAAAFLYLIKRTITYQADMVAAARRMVPRLVALMAWVFTTYILLKGLNRVWSIGFLPAVAVGLGLAILIYLIVRQRMAGTELVSNSKQSVNRLFTVPLMVAVALLSFAHGSNDVANAVGPLAAVVDVLIHGGGNVGGDSPIPWWVMAIGALGISVGLALFGPRLIRTVGSEITELDHMRAYCIAMATTLTVIIASQLGMPISTTHTAVGAVFGIGFLREYLKNQYDRMVAEIKAHHPADDQAAIDAFLGRFAKATVDEKDAMLRELKRKAKASMDPAHFSKAERKGLRKVYRRELVKRSQVMRIVAAWVITVPASAVMAALLFYMIRGMMLP